MALRGIVGIEAAIVLIAFVLVASALAFVAINMGMFSAQKSKEVMAKAYDAATHALDIAGNTIARVSNNNVTAILVPLKLTAGTAPVDLSKTTIRLVVTYDGSTLVANATRGDTCTVSSTSGDLDNDVNNLKTCMWLVATGNTNSLLEPGELIYLAFKIAGSGAPAYSTISIEIVPPIGAPLAAVYTVPPTVNSISSGFIDLILGS